MFYLDFLTQALEPGDSVTCKFLTSMLPSMLAAYAECSAKGGDHNSDTYEDETARQKYKKFEAKSDQGMVSHLLNGILPTTRLLCWLEQAGLGPIPFTEIERRVYILSYIMHDVDKIIQQMPDIDKAIQQRGIKTGNREEIEQTKAIVEKELRRCNVEQFFPDFAHYLEDITYLVVNAQQKYGTHLHTHLWQFQLKERRILLLRRLCTYSDQVAYLISSPAAILLDAETQTIRDILKELSNDQLVFTYHQVREVRGLLTNVINNGLVELFKAGREGEVWPYLFFSDGVVYIQRVSTSITITPEQIVETVQGRLRNICAETIKMQAPGFKFDQKGIVKYPAYYFEFLNLEEYCALLADFTIKGTRNDITRTPFANLHQMQANGEIPADLAMDFPAGDFRIGMVSRFLSVIFKTVLGMLEKHETLRKRAGEVVIEYLGLTPYWERSLAIPNKGGMEYRWFWLAGCYVNDHQGRCLRNAAPTLLIGARVSRNRRV